MKLAVGPRQLLAGAALAGAVALIPAVAIATSAGSSAPAARASAARLPRCARSQLTAWAALPADGVAALTTYYEFEISNVSRHACALDGFATVTAVTDTGRQLGSAAERLPPLRTRPVSIGPGQTAHYQLGIAVGGWSTSVCRPTTASALRVVAPGSRGGLQVPFAFTACAKRGPVYLTVTAIVANTGIPRYG
jgi:Protein of unknown function (DUF4232)